MLIKKDDAVCDCTADQLKLMLDNGWELANKPDFPVAKESEEGDESKPEDTKQKSKK